MKIPPSSERQDCGNSYVQKKNHTIWNVAFKLLITACPQSCPPDEGGNSAKYITKAITIFLLKKCPKKIFIPTFAFENKKAIFEVLI
ncbi:MAG: hypothetical protein B7Y83_09950 [Flavobacteriales bacterium 32-34-25]|nr:MAG: hypothetical protein B7Y83_09950 [Flavobacteriales bacterium 32-34-25]